MGKEGPKDRLEMVSRSQHGQRRSQDRLEMAFKRANLGKEGPEDRLEVVLKKPTWAKKVPKIE